MFETIGKLKVPYILSHIQGTPATMQDDPQYEDVIKEISTYFSEKVKRLTKLGAVSYTHLTLPTSDLV